MVLRKKTKKLGKTSIIEKGKIDRAAQMEKLKSLKSSDCEDLVKHCWLLILCNPSQKLQFETCPQAWLLPHLPPPSAKVKYIGSNFYRVLLANQQSLLQVGEGEELEDVAKEFRRKL